MQEERDRLRKIIKDEAFIEYTNFTEVEMLMSFFTKKYNFSLG